MSLMGHLSVLEPHCISGLFSLPPFEVEDVSSQHAVPATVPDACYHDLHRNGLSYPSRTVSLSKLFLL